MYKKIASSFRFSLPTLLVASLLFSLTPVKTFADDTTFKSPSAVDGFHTQWSNALNATSSNNVYATESNEDEVQSFENFGFVVPTSSIINGIQVTVEGFNSDSNGCQVEVQMWSTSDNEHTDFRTQAVTGTDTQYTLGSASDLWGSTWVPSDFNNASFHVQAQYDDSSSNSCSGSLSLDHIQVKVHYTPPVIPAANPTIGGSCGLDIALALDTSTSIDNTELATLKTAFVGFVNALLPGTPTMFSLIRFDDDASTVQTFTGDVGTITTAINGTDGSGFTNWEAGLNQADSTFDPRADKPNVIIFASDGNPTDSDGPLSDLDDAVTAANAIKGDGIRVITLGIGGDVNQANLEAISSADAYYSAANFSDVASALSDIALDLCGGTVTVHKLIDADGNLNTTGDQTDGVGWTFNSTVDTSGANGDDFSTPASGDTDVNGTLNFDINLGANDSATVGVSETLEPGYSQLSASCNVGTPASITLTPTDIVSCTFINTPVGKIIVDKVTDPSDDPQSFSFDAQGGSYADFSLDDNDTPNEQELSPGSYSVSENASPGWHLASAVCESSLGHNENVNSIDLNAGEVVTCTFTNERDTNLTAVKTNNLGFADALVGVPFNWQIVVEANADNLQDGAATFLNGEVILKDDLPSSGAVYGSVLDINGGGTTGTVDCAIVSDTLTCVANGTVVIPDGGTITITIPVTPTSDGSLINPRNPGVCQVDPNNNVVETIGGDNNCGNTVNVVKPATIVVIKDTVPNHEQDFAFTATGLSPSSFSLDDDADGTLSNTQTFNNVQPQNPYSVTETPVAGWDMSVVCKDQDNNVLDSAPLVPNAGDTITCVFTNTERGSITVTKLAYGGDETFPVTLSGDADDSDSILTSSGSGSVTFDNLVPGSYSVAEDLANLPEWKEVDSTCKNLTLAPGEDKQCEIRNVKEATIRVKKTTVGGVGQFDFTGSLGNFSLTTVTENVPVDSFFDVFVDIGGNNLTITETLPNGWANDNLVCQLKDVLPGSTPTCEFVNTKLPTLTLEKTVTNNSGGGASESDFQGKIDGSNVAWDTPTIVSVGSHTASEVANVSGYSPSAWGGACAPDGSVNLAPGQNATCTITNDDNAPSLRLIKEVINDNNGTAVAGDWTLTASGYNAQNPQTGTYNLSESGPSGYTQTSLTCSNAQGQVTSVTLGLGEQVTCTFVNDDVAPKLTLQKVLIKDNGGSAVPSDWSLEANGAGSNDVIGTHGVTSGPNLLADTFALSETGPAGYGASPWVCVGGLQNGSNITLKVGEEATCTITNDDLTPSLTLVKEVKNDNGGTAQADAWTLTATGPTGFSGNGPSVPSDASFDTGTYDLSESGPSGYSASAWVCVGGNQTDEDTVSVALGGTVTCTITNDDDAPSLTLVKEVNNDNGGEAGPEDWTLTAEGYDPDSPDADTYDLSEDGPDGYTLTSLTCSNADGQVDSVTLGLGEDVTCTFVNDDDEVSLILVKEVINDNGGGALPSAWTLSAGANDVVGSELGEEATDQAGTYALSESSVTGYTNTSVSCDNGDGPDSVTIGLGETVVCTFVNNDLAPGLTLVKQVTNNNGGTAVAGDWTLTAEGYDSNSPDAGTYNLSESGPSGYTQTSLTCSNAQGQVTSVTLGLGEQVTCTFVNDDNEPHLKLQKVVIGGPLASNAWNLKATGPSTISANGGVDSNNAVVNFLAGEYTLTETSANPGSIHYTTDGVWSCIGTGNVIDLALGDEVECEITNTYVPPGTIIIEKQTLPDEDQTEFEFTTDYSDNFLLADGEQNTSIPLVPGNYSVVETSNPDWDLSSAVCSDGSSPDNIELASGEVVICVFTNDQKPGKLTLVKVLPNNNGGTAEAGDFTVYINALESAWGEHTLDAGSYTISEDSLPGYVAGSWSGDCDESGNVTILPNDDKTCTITNDDAAAKLTVIKNVVNDNGGNGVASDFSLLINFNPNPNPAGQFPGSAVGTVVTLDAGPYGVAESIASGYGVPTFSADCAGNIAPGEEKICTVTNDDLAPSITLVKNVVNNNGGDAGIDDFGLSIGGTPVDSGETLEVLSNTPIALNETGLEGYTFVSITGDTKCPQVLGGTVTLDEGEDITCTITNDDSAAVLIVKKIVEGSDADESTFSFQINDGSLTAFESDGRNDVSITPGVYSVTEPAVEDYDTTYENCSNLDLALGETETCTITNTYNPPPEVGSIKVCKIVLDEDGNVIAGALGTTFTIPWLTDADYEGPEVGDPADAVFDTPLTLETVFGETEGECVTYSDLLVGRYYYGEEQVASDQNWLAPRYHDQFNSDVNDLSDPQEFNSNPDASFDNFDGVINLSADQTRTLIVVNQLEKKVEIPGCMDPEALNYNPNATVDDESCEYNSCPTPSALEDESDETINPAPQGEDDLQEVLDNAGYSLDAENDQTQYQTWNVTPNSEVTIDPVEFIDEFAGNSQVFGYYTDGSMTNFVPVFKTGVVTGFEAVPLASAGPFTINVGEVTSLGFAIKTFSGNTPAGEFATENSLNGGSDQVVVYNPSANTYVLAFEDRTGEASDYDYNDLVVEVTLSCSPVEPEDTATISAIKIICPTENLLPNWGAGAGPITSTTATDFLEANPSCYLADWTFEWAPNGTPNPGDEVEDAEGAWTEFNSTVLVPAGSLVWIREHFNSAYIPFTGVNTDQNVSAELYCYTDVLHYDNYDFINPVVAGETYHCVAWNAPLVPPPQECPEGYELQDNQCVPIDVCPEGQHEENEQCVPDVPPQCSDGLDNDEDENIDYPNDSGCESPDDDSENTEPTFAPQSTPEDDGNGGGSRSGDFRGGGSVAGASTGSVLGQSCGLYMDRFIRFGSSYNDVEQVKLLQTFLNKWMLSTLPITGIYDSATLEVLKAFQVKYASEVLTPWNLTSPTGIVYISTLRWINMLECPDLALTLPALIEWSRNPNVPKEPLASSVATPATIPTNSNTPVDEEGDNDEGEFEVNSLQAGAGGADEGGGGFINFLKKLFGR